MISDRGVKIWLGEVESDFTLKSGSQYKTKDGIEGEVRTIAEGKKIRMTWNKAARGLKPTSLQFYVMPGGEYINNSKKVSSSTTTSVRFHQEKLRDSKEREKMREYWQKALEKLDAVLL